MQQRIPECCRLVLEKLPYFSDQGGRDHIFLWSSEIFDPQAASRSTVRLLCPMAQLTQISIVQPSNDFLFENMSRWVLPRHVWLFSHDYHPPNPIDPCFAGWFPMAHIHGTGGSNTKEANIGNQIVENSVGLYMFIYFHVLPHSHT